MIFANRISICVRRVSATTLLVLSSSGASVLPVMRALGGRCPSAASTTVFGTFQFAAVGLAAGAVGWMPAKIVGLTAWKMIGGCDRRVALTCTPTLGTMYDALPRTVVSTGSTWRQ